MATPLHSGLSMPIDDTVWPIDPHGRAKHLILRRHLEAWLPIMTRTFRHLVYVDGFAGPGVYTEGEPGSPVIALTVATTHRLLRLNMGCELGFFFIEERSDRVDRLKDELRRCTMSNPLPAWIKYRVEQGEFAAVMEQWLDVLSRKGSRPMLVNIDPFGYSGFPMSLLRRIAAVQHSECLITFTHKSINRWGSHELKHDALDALYGTSDWRSCLGDERAMIDLYLRQLEASAGFRYSRTFTMKDRGGVTEYFLAFVTNDPKGLTVVKRAMWKADPQTGMVFSDANDPDQLFLALPIDPLRDRLRGRFRGRGWVPWDDIIEFVRQTPYSEEMHLVRGTLIPMEREGILEVERLPTARKGSFNQVSRLRFV